MAPMILRTAAAAGSLIGDLLLDLREECSDAFVAEDALPLLFWSVSNWRLVHRFPEACSAMEADWLGISPVTLRLCFNRPTSAQVRQPVRAQRAVVRSRRRLPWLRLGKMTSGSRFGKSRCL